MNMDCNCSCSHNGSQTPPHHNQHGYNSMVTDSGGADPYKCLSDYAYKGIDFTTSTVADCQMKCKANIKANSSICADTQLDNCGPGGRCDGAQGGSGGSGGSGGGGTGDYNSGINLYKSCMTQLGVKSPNCANKLTAINDCITKSGKCTSTDCQDGIQTAESQLCTGGGGQGPSGPGGGGQGPSGGGGSESIADDCRNNLAQGPPQGAQGFSCAQGECEFVGDNPTYPLTQDGCVSCKTSCNGGSSPSNPPSGPHTDPHTDPPAGPPSPGPPSNTSSSSNFKWDSTKGHVAIIAMVGVGMAIILGGVYWFVKRKK